MLRPRYGMMAFPHLFLLFLSVYIGRWQYYSLFLISLMIVEITYSRTLKVKPSLNVPWLEENLFVFACAHDTGAQSFEMCHLAFFFSGGTTSV